MGLLLERPEVLTHVEEVVFSAVGVGCVRMKLDVLPEIFGGSGVITEFGEYYPLSQRHSDNPDRPLRRAR